MRQIRQKKNIVTGMGQTSKNLSMMKINNQNKENIMPDINHQSINIEQRPAPYQQVSIQSSNNHQHAPPQQHKLNSDLEHPKPYEYTDVRQMLEYYPTQSPCNNNLLLEYKYWLNNSNSKWLSVGINPLQNFQIVVKINYSTTRSCLYFNIDDWIEFTKCKDTIIAHLNGNSNVEFQGLRQISIYFTKIDNIPIIQLECCGKVICLGSHSLNSIFVLEKIVNNYISILESLNLNLYFNNLMIQCVLLGNDILENIRSLLLPDNSLYTIAMLELLLFYSSFITNYYSTYYQ